MATWLILFNFSIQPEDTLHRAENVTDGASDIGHLDALDLGLFGKEAILYGARQFRGILALTDGRRALCIWTEHD